MPGQAQDDLLSDRDYMRLALDLAERGRLTARPNPMVGAVVVKSGRIVGSGYHVRPGTGHAEVNALADVPDDVAKGSTVYVSLEPCDFTGRTPACSDLLVARQVSRVVCAMEDPDDRVAGSGLTKLKAAGIDVEVGVLAEQAERLNVAYLTHRRLGRPYVTLKMAQSTDGSAATLSGDSKWITGPGARKRGHAIRAEAQVVAVGIGTVLADNPTLNVRHSKGEDPVKVVFDSDLRTPLDANVLDGERCIICASETADADRAQAFRDRGVDVWLCESADGKPDVRDVLKRLGERDVIRMLVEGGSRLASSFLNARMIDRVAVFTAPKLMGGMPSIADLGIKTMKDVISLENSVVERIGQDFYYGADVRFA